jgi:hypothetical protein
MKQEYQKGLFRDLYREFEMPLCELDCGLKCGPHNDYGVPVCCDIQLVVPAAFELEWSYLQENTDLWQPWSSSGLIDRDLAEQVQDGQVLLECKGYQQCQRSFRTLTCRAFPFYPYLTSQGLFSGLAYYSDFREECWIISNLAVVSTTYKVAFQGTFNKIFDLFPGSRDDFLDYCCFVRDEAAEHGEQIVVLDFQAGVGLVDPLTETVTPVGFQDLDAYGPFAVARELPFPDEIQAEEDDR